MNNKKAIECFENYVYSCEDCGMTDECHKQDELCMMIQAEVIAIDKLTEEE